MHPCIKTIMASFMVVKLALPFNIVMGRPLLHDLIVAAYMRYLGMKFLTKTRVEEVKGN